MKRHTVMGSNGIRLSVVETGRPEGQPILFVHGWSQSLLCWKKQLESSLAGRFRLVALDIRGHGDSDKPLDGYDDCRTWAGDLQAVIDALSLARPILVGWSYGGLILNDYVRVNGDEGLAGLCYVGAATDLGVETPYDFLGATWSGLLPAAPQAVAGTVFSTDAEEVAKAMRSFLRGCFSKPLSTPDEMMMLGFNLVCPSRVRAALFGRALHNDDVLARLTAPVFVSHGATDEVIRVGTGRHIATRAKHSTFSLYEEVGHAPFWEEPERFNRELAHFVTAA